MKKFLTYQYKHIFTFSDKMTKLITEFGSFVVVNVENVSIVNFLTTEYLWITICFNNHSKYYTYEPSKKYCLVLKNVLFGLPNNIDLI